MKHLAKVLVLVMAAAMVFGVAACGQSEHTHTAGTTWESDQTKHWHECTECGEVLDEAAHTVGEWQIDAESGEHYRACTVCGHEADRTAHTPGEWQIDAESGEHYRVCTVCGQEADRAAHTPGEWQIDAESGEHYRVCTVCGQETDRAAHTAGDELYFNEDYTQQWNECTVCGAHLNEAAHTHTADETAWESDGSDHWRVCSVCGQKIADTQTAHVSDETLHFNEDYTQQWNECTVCGAHLNETAHTHAGEAWESDGTDHWQVCDDCGQTFGREAHISDETLHFNEDYTQQWNECTVCGTHLNETAHTHGSEAWESGGTDHWQICGDCGQTFGREAHTAGEWIYDAESGKEVQSCAVCGYRLNEREHTVHVYTVWSEDGQTVSCACGEVFEGFSEQKINLDLQYDTGTLEITTSATGTFTIDLSLFGNISGVTAEMLRYDGDNINIHNVDGKALQSSFAEGVLTINVSEFGFAYSDRTVAISFTDQGGTARTIRVPVLLVTKVIMNRTDLDNMTYFSKESEAAQELIYGGYFELGADISYSGQFNYVMPSNIDASKGGFVGVFDGCGYTIDGLQINTVDSSAKWNNYHGMFGSLYGGTVKNVCFTNAVIGVKGSLISAYGSGTIENVYASFKEMRVNNPLGLAFSQGVGGGGATIRDCVVDVSNASFSLVSGATTYQFCFFGKKQVHAPKLEGAYLIGQLPEGTTTWTEVANLESGCVYGRYDSMDAFAEAYNAADSALKAEIDTWDTTWWQITDGKILFVDKSAA